MKGSRITYESVRTFKKRKCWKVRHGSLDRWTGTGGGFLSSARRKWQMKRWKGQEFIILEGSSWFIKLSIVFVSWKALNKAVLWWKGLSFKFAWRNNYYYLLNFYLLLFIHCYKGYFNEKRVPIRSWNFWNAIIFF